MPTNPSPAGWQHAGPTTAPTAAAPNWQQSAATPASASWLPTRRLGVGLVWLAFLVFCTALVWVATWVSPPRTVGLVLIGAGYEDNPVFPANSAGLNTLRDLAAYAKKPIGAKEPRHLLRLAKDRVHELRTDAPWDAPLSAVTESTLLLVISAHGGSDIAGPFLLPTNTDARPLAKHRLYIKDLLPRLQDMARHTKIVVVFDVVHMPSHWPLGMLHNDFARELAKLDDDIRKIPHLVVIVSSGPDELSWPSHEWKRTIFGHHLIEGLRGGADADGKKKIDAWDLFKYTEKKVEHWARLNRAARQAPILLPNRADGLTRARAIILNNVDRDYKEAEFDDQPEGKKTDAKTTSKDDKKDDAKDEKKTDAKDDKKDDKKDEKKTDAKDETKSDKGTMFGADSDLTVAWQKWLKLRASLPSPQVYSPHAWQQYQAALLQYETALRFGDRLAALKKWDRLIALERTIAEAKPIRLRTLDATLAMPAVTALATGKLDADTDAFLKKFWEAKGDDDVKDAWDEAKTKLWKDRPVPVREMAGWLLDQLAQEKLAGLPRVADRLRRIRPADRPLPAEAHWVVMMQRDLPAQTRTNPEVSELFAIALDVRLQAEQCAVAYSRGNFAYSEQVQPWIADALTQADQQRQFGQDLLIGTNKSDWTKARGYFKQAADAYRDITTQAEIVRKALATRDQVQSILPAYSHWLARRPALAMPNAPVEDPKLEAPTLELWKELHALTPLLDLASRERERPEKPAALKEQTERVAKAFAALEKRFDQYLESLFRAQAPSADHASRRFIWLETESALLVPQPDLPRRMGLLKRQHVYSRGLLANSTAIKDTTLFVEDPVQVAKRQGRNEGELALALLGQAWFDRFAGVKGESYLQVRRQLEVSKVETPWTKTIGEAGDQIGKRYRQMPLEVTRLLKPADKAEKVSPRAALYAADLIARRMEATLQLPDALDPVAEQRRSQLGSFLVAQARRTIQDHWYDLIPSAEPYYTATARSFLGDARSLIPTGKRDLWSAALKQTVGALEKKLQDASELIVRDTTDANGSAVKSLPVITSEQQWDREYRVVPTRDADEVPAGFPSLWLEDTASLRAVEPTANERVTAYLAAELAPGSAPRGDRGASSAAKYDFRLMSPLVGLAEEKGNLAPFVERTPLLLRGLYRGQPLWLETPVDINPEPTTVIRQYPLPDKASVAVRTSKDLTVRVGTNDSAMVFVLDCSGSMASQDPTDPTKGRYWRALQALRLVLQKVPKDTTVSVWTFGMAVEDGKTTQRPEDTIAPALKPTPWNAGDSRQLDGLIATLEAMEPWNQSPISRTLLFAREDLKSVRGNKTIVAITDGHDNRFDLDEELVARYKNVPEMLKGAFDKSDIALHMVFFPPTEPKEQKAQEEYKLIETFKVPGKIHSIADVGKLGQVLDLVMRQRLNYWVDKTGANIGVNEIPESGLDVSTSDRNDRWFGKGLPPGGHKLRVNVPDRIEKDVRLNRGDLLLLDLVATPTGTMFERYLFSDDYAWKARLENKAKDWRLAVLQNQLLDKDRLEMLATLEKTVDRRETVLEQIKPREAWIELRLPPEVSAEYSTRWSHLPGYPAPAWSIDVPQWPTFKGTTTAARPVLHVWWNPDEEARSAAELQVLPLLKERNHPVVVRDQKNVVVESAVIEKHRVEVKRGIFEYRPCLVVRIRHELNQPILTRLEGMDSAGAEHRFYAKAGKYAGLYWWDGDKAPTLAAAARLRIIAVNALKAEAERRGYMLEMRDLQSPEPSDFRPRAPIELK